MKDYDKGAFFDNIFFFFFPFVFSFQNKTLINNSKYKKYSKLFSENIFSKKEEGNTP
jgi:hypothetical protein